jgi:hypothetical protein
MNQNSHKSAKKKSILNPWEAQFRPLRQMKLNI